MNDRTKDPFACWWWPGQWLHIVYGIWIDQLWYWQNMRPRLHGRTKGWGIWAQGMLGAGIIGFALAAFAGVILSVIGTQVRWEFLFPAVAIGIGLGVGLGMLGVVASIGAGMVTGIVTAVCLSTMFGVSAGWGGTQDMILGNAQSFTILSVIGPIVMTISLGVGRVVFEGDKWSVPESLIVAILMFGATLTYSQVPKPEVIIAQAVAIGAGLYLSGRWAARQVPDNELRKRLANPNKQNFK